MLWRHPDHPGRAVRLGYCLNQHPADDLAGLVEGLRAVTVPLREELSPSRSFGIGPYLPANVALHLASEAGSADLAALKALLVENGLEAFTFNAFPYGGFHRPGLKERVFEPTWLDERRLEFTLAVAEVALELAPATLGHVSISTHTGMHASRVRSDEDLAEAARNLGRCAAGLARLEQERGVRVVLSLEAEPRASAGDTAELARFRERTREVAAEAAGGETVLDRHLGACLDTCHAAVEFEEPEAAVANAVAGGAPLGKLQLTSALALARPAENAAAREELLAMDEPVFLHQVTARAGGTLARAGDLPEARARFERGESPWTTAAEWRCHFHVPLDLERLGERGLATTRAHAAATLERALALPSRWGTDELHVEIETYTWSVLPRAARGTGELADGLEREVRHAIALLERSGWRRAP